MLDRLATFFGIECNPFRYPLCRWRGHPITRIYAPRHPEWWAEGGGWSQCDCGLHMQPPVHIKG